ncbi:MAG: MHYT domain-containing protein [Frankia sp.]
MPGMANYHATYDHLFLAASVALALVGSFAALVSAIRIPLAAGAARHGWTATAAVALGGGAIWSMHFLGMLAYHIDHGVTYNITDTATSLVIAIAASGLGLAVVAHDQNSSARLGIGGVIAGLGVAAMHYTGMAAMETGGPINYDVTMVTVSVVIAVVAALAALWIAFRVRSTAHVLIASAVMAVAVCGMHYTGMAATRVRVTANPVPSGGIDPTTIGMFVCMIAFIVLAVVIAAALGGVSNASSFELANGRRGTSPRTGRERRTPEPAGRARHTRARDGRPE